jgi:hypothetical protein
MKIKMNLSTLLAAVAFAALLLPAGKTVEAQGRGRHPAYIHALADLRLARAYLDRLTPNEVVDAGQAQAIKEIDAAIHDIKFASIDDGKSLNDHVAIDTRIQPRDRFMKAKEALDAALRDVGMEEDDPNTKGLQQRSINHIHDAFRAVQQTMERLHIQ